jgi:hypothetical protein
MRGDRKPSRIAAVLALLGGAAIVFGCYSAWVDTGGGVSVGTVTVTGMPNGNKFLLGQVALGAGIAVALFGLLLLLLRRARRVLGLLILIGGLVAMASAAYVARSPQDRYVDFAAETGAPAGQEDEVRTSLSNLFEVSNLHADVGTGVFVVLGGGAVSVIAGLASIFGRRKAVAEETQLDDSDDMASLSQLEEQAAVAGAGTTAEPPVVEEAPPAEPSGSRDETATNESEGAQPPKPSEAEQVESKDAIRAGDTSEQTEEPEHEEPRTPSLGDEWHF